MHSCFYRLYQKWHDKRLHSKMVLATPDFVVVLFRGGSPEDGDSYQAQGLSLPLFSPADKLCRGFGNFQKG